MKINLTSLLKVILENKLIIDITDNGIEMINLQGLRFLINFTDLKQGIFTM